MSKAPRDGDTKNAPPNISSWPGKGSGQKPSDQANNIIEHDDGNEDPTPQNTEVKRVLMATDVRKLDSVGEHPSASPARVPMSEYLSNLPRPPRQEKIPPSERYRPRARPTPLPKRPSLTRASATYDSKPVDDLERRSSKRVSFQQAPVPLCTPPSTSASSPVSPCASPNSPWRAVLSKPPPVSIPPGHYTPIAATSPVSPSPPPATRKAYTCLVPTCNSYFDRPYGRDRHERQHAIGDPPYSTCPICRFSLSGGTAVGGGVRETLIAHMDRRHKADMEPANSTHCAKTATNPIGLD